MKFRDIPTYTPRLVALVAVSTIVVSTLFAFESAVDSAVAQGTVTQVALVMENIRSESTRHTYSELRSGLRRQKVSAKISVLTHEQLSDAMFADYAVVVLVSERRRDIISPKITSFVQKHADNDQLITLAFLPNGRSTLTRPPEGVDVISSASREGPAKRLVMDVVAPEVKTRIATRRRLRKGRAPAEQG